MMILLVVEGEETAIVLELIVEIEDEVELSAHDVALLLLLAPFVFLLLEFELATEAVCFSSSTTSKLS